MVEALLWAWAAWAAANVGLFLLAAWVLPPPDSPSFNGFSVRVPDSWRLALTGPELEAVVQHERGHRDLGHVWVNLLLLCCLCPASAERRMRQELAADDCVADPLALSSALAKMSRHPFDLFRAARLASRCLESAGVRPADLTPGTGELRKEESGP